MWGHGPSLASLFFHFPLPAGTRKIAFHNVGGLLNLWDPVPSNSFKNTPKSSFVHYWQHHYISNECLKRIAYVPELYRTETWTWTQVESESILGDFWQNLTWTWKLRTRSWTWTWTLRTWLWLPCVASDADVIFSSCFFFLSSFFLA